MSKLISTITEANGYRPEFVRFMKTHLVEPRQDPYDKVYEWARSIEMTRRGYPGCRCMQNMMMMLDAPDEWKNTLRWNERRLKKTIEPKYFSADTYGGNPAPARHLKNNKPKPKPKLKGDPIVAAIRKLDIHVSTNWLKSGKPSVRALEKMLGYDITSAERDKAWQAVQAQHQITPSPKLTPPPNVSPPAPRPSLIEKIDKHSISVSNKQVSNALLGTDLGYYELQFLDRQYQALPIEIWSEILEWSDVDRAAYVAEKRDCDNFAIALVGQITLRLGVNGIGIVLDYVGKHAYCMLLVHDEGQLSGKLIEPQSDKIAQVGDRLGRNEAYTGKGTVIFP